jgi:branched-chain amino acid transport system substrate-binding protein
VHGRRIRVIALDDAYDPKRAADNVRQLLDQDKVLALFNLTGTPTNMAALPIAKQQKVPLVAPFSGFEALRSNENKGVFNVRAGYGDEINKIVQHLSTLGIQQVAVAYMNNAFGKQGLESVKTSAAKYGVSLVASATLELDGKGLAAAAAEMSKLQPKAIVLVSAGKLTSDFIAEYQKTAAVTQFYALSVISSQQLISALGSRSTGIVIAQVMPYPWGGSTQLARDLTALAAGKGLQNVTYNHMEGYVSAKVLVEALRLAGPGVTREALARALESLKDLDLGGYRVRFSDRNRNGSTYVELTIVGSEKRVIR